MRSWRGASALAAVLAVGCQAPALVDPGADGPVVYPHHTERESVVLSADPYFEEARVRQVFGELIADRSVLPVLVRVENASAQSVVVRPDDLQLRPASGAGLEQTEDVERRRVNLVAVLLVGAWVAVADMRVERTKADARLSELVLRSTTLAPGASAEGFVYFGLPAGEMPERLALTWTLSVPGSTGVSFELPLDRATNSIGAERR